MAALEKKIEDAKKMSKPLLHIESTSVKSGDVSANASVKFLIDKSQVGIYNFRTNFSIKMIVRLKNAAKTTKVSSITNVSVLTLMRNRVLMKYCFMIFF